MQKSEEAWRFIIIPTHAVIICRYITVDGGAMECSLFEIQRQSYPSETGRYYEANAIRNTVEVDCVIILFCILNVPGLILGPEASYPD